MFQTDIYQSLNQHRLIPKTNCHKSLETHRWGRFSRVFWRSKELEIMHSQNQFRQVKCLINQQCQIWTKERKICIWYCLISSQILTCLDPTYLILWTNQTLISLNTKILKPEATKMFKPTIHLILMSYPNWISKCQTNNLRIIQVKKSLHLQTSRNQMTALRLEGG